MVNYPSVASATTEKSNASSPENQVKKVGLLMPKSQVKRVGLLADTENTKDDRKRDH